MHVGGVLVFDGEIAREDVVERIRERVHLIPRYAMRLDEAPLGISHPVWENDPGFDPGRHVRRAGLPAPGGDAELAEFTAGALSDPLDRSRPLWQLWVVSGLEAGRSAIVAKMHHALVDGIAAIDVSTVILDPTPEKMELPPPGEAAPAREGGMPGTALADPLTRIASPWLQVPRRMARRTMDRALELDPRKAAGDMKRAAEVVGELARKRAIAPDTRLNVEIGPDRRFALARGSLADVKAVRQAAGATVNDVLLGAVALMLEEYLGDEGPSHAVALVPVSVRKEAEEGELGNHISTVFVELPLRGDPLDRVRAISNSMAELKESAAVRAGALIVGATGLAPPLVSSLAVRAMSGPRLFNLVVSNVPGPQATFYLGGVPMREAYPAVPLNPRNQALSIGILSYDGAVGFGLLADYALGDVADAAAGLERALATLVAAAG